MENAIENPFIKHEDILCSNKFNDTRVKLTQSNAYKYFDHVFILIPKSNKPIPIEFYMSPVNKDIFREIASNFILFKTGVSILKIQKHFDNCLNFSDEILSPYNIFDYQLDDNNLVVPILNIEFKNILKYLEQYQSTDNVRNIYNLVIINQYYLKDSNNKIICKSINNLEESDYWTLECHCKSFGMMTDIFKNRTINFQSNRMKDKKIFDIINKIFPKKTINNNQHNYLKEMEINKKDDYVDISTALYKKKFSNYKLNKCCDFTHDNINQLFDNINEKQKFLLFANLIVSKKYCHLVINNKYILQTMKNQINKFAQIFKYLFSYAWIRFYTDECIKKSYISKSDDFIFDIDTASELPVFPFNHHKPQDNPYSPIIVSDSELDPSKNVCGIGDYGKMYSICRICDLKKFKFRMNIFCTSDSTKDIFKGYDFNKYNTAISGSIMTACIQVFHPLTSRLVNDNNSKNDEDNSKLFNDYFNEYYSESDVDIMFIAKTDLEFITNVYNLYNQVVVNICNFNSYAEPSHTKLILNKLGYIFVTKEFIIKNINIDNIKLLNESARIKYIIENIDNDIIKSKFKPFYEKLKIEEYNKLIKDCSEQEIKQLKIDYPDIYNCDDIDFKIYISNKYSSEKENINLKYIYKYRIESPYINHPLELFPIKYKDFFSVVSRFHLPCVRSYYTGSNVYMTPSCISAHMTFMNLDYKYITGSKDPFDIINKYRMRGFGTWLNINEKKLFIKYCRNVPFWNNLYSGSSKNIFGILSLNHKLFRPRLYNMESFNDVMYVDLTNRYNDNKDFAKRYFNTDDLIEYIESDFKSIRMSDINWSKISSINKHGNIVPLKKWIIDFVWNMYGEDNEIVSNKIGYDVDNDEVVDNDGWDDEVVDNDGWDDEVDNDE